MRLSLRSIAHIPRIQSAGAPAILGSIRHTHGESAQPTLPSPLPPTFRSLYRLFLRATAASVLAHPDATSRLRKSWRAVFDHAANAVRQMEDARLSADQRDSLTHWYVQWESRMDNTISLLHSSAVSRGLPHQVTRNLSRMMDANCTLRDPSLPNKKPWRGQLSSDAPEYKRKRVKPTSPTQEEQKALFRACPRLLGDIVGMAEGWGGLSLGRTQRRC
ncbi:uncharacterized protein TRAVEDRAFT_153968 [Trametes versicolor FP-101664 SS1]|uniref:uncharacterized protein n=1 Tax=Trametes versicolor (strain FP-101664) TaxID=717944 RepID=UPI00046244AC|nr:uncharacterized protein TRAVEDRAFT_153968 [Trametes versicolor FP-101664 SS1]EIW54015.1 hypothetical protein TRAVEDRAFT_153968 [Trametes versicolor FP-101664 SS1]